MKLAELIQDLPDARVVGQAEAALAADIAAVREDSRAVQPGDLFVAVRGRRSDGHACVGRGAARASDGHAYVEQAVARGAAALVVEHEVPVAAAQVVVADAAEAL